YFVIFVLSCTKETITPREYPRGFTRPVSNISSNGVVFQGEIFFTSVEVTDYGFVWSNSWFPTINNSEKISLGSTTVPISFETTINRGLESGKSYTVRAYAISASFVVYG